MYNIDWLLFIREFLPVRLRKLKRINFIRAALAPLITLHSQFIAFVDKTKYELAFTSQIMYLEKLLNDQFNNGADAYTAGTPTGIYISDPTTRLLPIYVWNAIEQRPDFYLYNDWTAVTAYHIGDRIAYAGKIYRATHNNLNKQPDTNPIEWTYVKEEAYLRNDEEYAGEFDFVVNIPNAVGSIADPLFTARVRAWIEKYRQAPRRYSLVNY